MSERRGRDGARSRGGRTKPAGFLLPAVVLTAALLAGCASLTARPGDRATDAATERARADKLHEAYQQLEQAHQQLQREHELLVRENQRLDGETQRLAGETQRLTSETQRLQRERQTLQEAARRSTTGAASEEELARLRLQLLEKDAQIKLLSQKLEAAILEVVRALAKLRSLESKAEAATTMAEAEIAVRMLERNAGREKDPDVVQAESLLKLGAQEFRKDNYSGALYLSSQAKSLIKDGPPGLAGSERPPKVDGEVPFALPLLLRLVARGEAREGPGPNFKVVFPLADGTPVVAHSYKGLWVKIRGDDGRSGWVRYNFVGQRQ